MIGDFGLAVALGYSTSLADLANGGCGTIKGWVWWVSKNVLYAIYFTVLFYSFILQFYTVKAVEL